jgi:hypothetical protein
VSSQACAICVPIRPQCVEIHSPQIGVRAAEVELRQSVDVRASKQVSSENEIPSLLEDRSILHWSVDDPQLEDHNTRPVGERGKSQTGPYHSLGKGILSLSNPTQEIFAISKWIESVDPILHGELRESRNVTFHLLKLDLGV